MDVVELLEMVVTDGIIELECKTCGYICTTEPDNTGFCENCQEVINNPLLDQGMI